jgi:hypothetical protein
MARITYAWILRKLMVVQKALLRQNKKFYTKSRLRGYEEYLTAMHALL